jgi:hypothetical protein
MRHVVILQGRRAEVIWNAEAPCPWNLRSVLLAANWKARGIEECGCFLDHACEAHR